MGRHDKRSGTEVCGLEDGGDRQRFRRVNCWGRGSRAGFVVMAVLLATIPPAQAVAGQSFAPDSPEHRAGVFYQSFQAGQWAEMADALHPDALALFQRRVLSVVRTDTTGHVARDVFGAEPRQLETMPAADLFERLLRGVLSYAPGMIQAMTGKSVRVLGHVVESTYGPEAIQGEAARDAPTAHVVVRSREPLTGSAPSRVGVLSMAQHAGTWKVIGSEELDVIATALVAVPRPN